MERQPSIYMSLGGSPRQSLSYNDSSVRSLVPATQMTTNVLQKYVSRTCHVKDHFADRGPFNRTLLRLVSACQPALALQWDIARANSTWRNRVFRRCARIPYAFFVRYYGKQEAWSWYDGIWSLRRRNAGPVQRWKLVHHLCKVVQNMTAYSARPVAAPTMAAAP